MIIKRIWIILTIVLFLNCGFFADEPNEITKEYTFNLSAKIILAPQDKGALAPPVAGLAYSPDKALLEGQEYKGRLLFRNQEALGHEVWHLLAYQYPDKIWDPDEINKVLKLGR
uniref:Uncharacterized protein n=1 Tax=viral metagenome TaxID=1070528 RepID=A0A6M3LDH8_9ZZZZ